jgi:hypothetical protein
MEYSLSQKGYKKVKIINSLIFKPKNSLFKNENYL